jgi:hypothetical protein
MCKWFERINELELELDLYISVYSITGINILSLCLTNRIYKKGIQLKLQFFFTVKETGEICPKKDLKWIKL